MSWALMRTQSGYVSEARIQTADGALRMIAGTYAKNVKAIKVWNMGARKEGRPCGTGTRTALASSADNALTFDDPMRGECSPARRVYESSDILHSYRRTRAVNRPRHSVSNSQVCC